MVLGSFYFLESLKEFPANVTYSKSQIAIELAHQVHVESPHVSVFWIHASSIDRFRDGYHSIVDECDIPGRDNQKCDKMMLLKEWLEKKHRNWLMIIDNADEASFFTSRGELSQSKSKTRTEQSILEYLPESSHGSILVTTRNRAAGVKFTKSRADDLVEVNTMTDEESECLIRSALTDDNSTDSEIHQLVNLLGRLPLALAQAAAFMHENVISVNEYIELYNESDETQMDLLSESFETLGRDSEVPNAVTTTFIVSINQIKERDPKAIDILCLIAFVDQHDIPKSLLQGKVKRPIDLTKSLGTLKAFSLVTAGERGSFSLHRLVQLVMRKWLIIEDKFEDQTTQAMDIIAELFPNAKFEQWSACAMYLPHAQSILGFVPELHGEDLRRRLYLQEGIAYYLWTQGYYNEAENLDLLIVEENKKKFGIEHPETLESLEGLASTYESQGKWAEAVDLDRLIVDIREKTLGPTHELTLTHKVCLAKLLNRQGQLTEAESLMLEVLETEKSLLGEDHESTIDTMAALGANYIEMGQLEKAEDLTKCAWGWRKKIYGLEHNHTLDAATTLGVIYFDQDRLQEAEKLTLQTVEAQENNLGPKHPGTLTSKGNLVRIYREMEEWGKAEELALWVIRENSKRVGIAHYDTLVSRQKLVDIYFHKGLVELADTLEDRILEDSIRSLGLNHPFTLRCMHDTAITRKRQGRIPEAIQLMVQVVSQREKVLGSFHDDTLMPFGTLCTWCGDQDAIEKLIEAEEK